MLAAFAAMALSAVAATGASAAFTLSTDTCSSAEPFTALCDESTALTGTETFAGGLVAGAATLLAAKFGAEEVHIECTGATVAGTFTATPLTANVKVTKLVITFTGCAVLEPLGKKCSVSSTLTTNSVQGEITGTGSEDKFEPEPPATVFIPITFSNSTETCPATIKGTKNVTGSQKCVNVEPEVFAVEKEISCLESGSSLKLGENAAEFKLPVKIHLVNNTEKIKVSKA